MKPRFLTISFVFLLFIMTSCNHTPKMMTIGPLTLSTSTPNVGEQVNLRYQTNGSELAGLSDLEGTLYYAVKRNLYAVNLPLADSGSVWHGSFTLPDTAQAFGLKFSSGDKIDKNGGKGYVFLVYDRSGKPVIGALAAESQFYNAIGSFVLKLKQNPGKALTLLQQSISRHPELKSTWQDTYLFTLYTAKKDTAFPKIRSYLKQMLSDTDITELNYLTARNLYNIIGMKSQADSLKKLILKNYPQGILVKNDKLTAFTHLKNVDSLVVAYNQFKKQFPASDSKSSGSFSFKSYMASRIAMAYGKAGQLNKFQQYASQVTNKFSLAGLYNQVAWPLAEKGQDLAFADSISKKSLDLLQQEMNNPGSDKPSYYTKNDWTKMIKGSYGIYADTYAMILAKTGRYEEALPYQKKAVEYTHEVTPDINARYATYLIKTGHDSTAQKEMEKFIKEGKYSQKMIGYLKSLYIKQKGSKEGFTDYLSALEATANKKLRAKLAKEMINKPAPDFTLPDLKGNHISLASLRGKVVVVDFWATWCGPCKASFPGMQKTVTKFKNNPNVVFLFVDTWERTKPAVRLKEVSDFIKQHKYTFHVLLDQHQPKDSTQYQIVDKYGVSGIPTKFVIDPKGHIRFKVVGFNGGQTVKEVSAMISMAKQSS